MTVPKVISVDCETYGMCERDHAGRALPPQRHFHPIRSLHQDNVPLESLILTTAVTFPRENPRCGNLLDDADFAGIPLTSPSATAAPPTPPSNPSLKDPLCPEARTLTTPSVQTPTATEDSSPLGSPPLSVPSVKGSGGWSLKHLMNLKPGPTMLLEMWNPTHLRLLVRCLQWADTLLGVNLLFDIPYWRRFSPDLYFALNGRHTILDFIYIRYLLSELSTARSLKDFGPLHGLYTYSEEQLAIKQGIRYKDPHCPKFQEYQCSDPHNSIVAVAHAANTIFFEYGKPLDQEPSCSSSDSSSASSSGSSPDGSTPPPRTDPPHVSQGTSKLSPHCIAHYSSLWWTCVRIVESGIPVGYNPLKAVEDQLLASAAKKRELCSSNNLQLSGKNSEHSKTHFLQSIFTSLDNPKVRDMAFRDSTKSLLDPPSDGDHKHSFVEWTEKAGRICINDVNRSVATVLLEATNPTLPAPPPPEPPEETSKKGKYRGVLGQELFPEAPKPITATALELLKAWGESTTEEKLVSSNTFPLLRHHRKDPDNQESVLIPWTPTRHSSLAPLRTHTTGLEPDIGLGFPTIYTVPSNIKDDAGASGGQKQSRLSFKNPAAPTWNKRIKACIRSRYRDGVVWIFDLSQIELRVAGLISGEQTILDSYTLNRDLHTDRAIDNFGEAYLLRKYPTLAGHNPRQWKIISEDFDEHERYWCKHFNFADLYLSGAKELQHQFLNFSGVFLPLAFFYKIVDGRKRLRPQLVAWQQHVLRTCDAQGYFELPIYGQSRYFIGGRGTNPVGEMVNFPIQATAANAMHAIMAEIHSILPSLGTPIHRVHPFLNWYDAGLIDAHPSEAKHVPTIVEEAVARVTSTGYWSLIQDHYGRACPLKYDIKPMEHKDAG